MLDLHALAGGRTPDRLKPGKMPNCQRHGGEPVIQAPQKPPGQTGLAAGLRAATPRPAARRSQIDVTDWRRGAWPRDLDIAVRRCLQHLDQRRSGNLPLKAAVLIGCQHDDLGDRQRPLGEHRPELVGEPVIEHQSSSAT